MVFRHFLLIFLSPFLLRDWCLSRQLWWGHCIPAYKCSIDDGKTHKWFAAASEKDARVKASSFFSCQPTDPQLVAVQDEDVLDTWFSSSLLPFSSLGWPGQVLTMEIYLDVCISFSPSWFLFELFLDP